MEKHLTADEKQEALWQRVLSPKTAEGNDLPFKSPEAEANYKASITRIKDAIQFKQPDRVPVTIIPSMFPYYFGGINVEEAMYDYDKCAAAFKKFVLEFEPDMHGGASMPGPGKLFEILDYKLYAWPGHGVAPDHSYQCLEDEYMKADEYDALIQDPSNFWRSTYMPRVFGALASFNMLNPLTTIIELGMVGFLSPYGLPSVQTAYQALLDAGAEAQNWSTIIGDTDRELASLGYPNLFGGVTKAPFDTIGDTLRGTKGIMLDIYRQPDKLNKAMEVMTPILINMGVGTAQQTGNPLILMPLHKGADDFLSDEQFKKFYWPTFRQVIMGLINEGCIPFPALEGHWDSRLDVIQDVPKGKTAWMVDQSDMVRVKETLGKNACLIGNVSSSMLNLSTPDEVKEYTKHLIDIVGNGGGYIVSNGAFFDHAKPENLKAMVEAAKEYDG